MISDNARAGMQQAPARSLFNALGFTPEEMKKPMVGIVSSFNEIVPGHMNIDKIVEAVERAKAFYNDKENLEEARKRAMSVDSTWRQSAQKYVEVYSSLL